jgi:hypothetical protein
VLQALHLAGLASALALITSLVPFPLFSAILYFTGKNDPARIMWTYVMSDAFSTIVTTLFLIKPAKMLKESPEEGEEKSALKMGLIDGEEKPSEITNVSLAV